jgi:uncharacterized protein (DUF433 family)
MPVGSAKPLRLSDLCAPEISSIIPAEMRQNKRRLNVIQSHHEFMQGRITVHPDRCNGHPTVRGTRITVDSILSYLGAGDSKEEILEQYPSLEPEDIDACLQFAHS